MYRPHDVNINRYLTTESSNGQTQKTCQIVMDLA